MRFITALFLTLVLAAPVSAADFSIQITVPDAAVPGLLEAMRWHYGQVDDGVGGKRDMTPQELRAKLKEGVVDSLKGMDRRYKKWQRDQQPVADPPAID